jgi:SAM-dependent methyltransferase
MHRDPRADPRIWQPDWLPLRDQARAIRAALAHPALRLGGARVLDFGCGSRPYEPWFTAAGARYEGADIDGSPEVAVRADGTLAAADGQYDLVASFQVLEHVRDLALYLSEAKRVLRPGGALLLSTHGTWLYHPHPEDHRRWTRPGLIAELSNYGFEVVECMPVVGPLATTTILRLTGANFALRKLPIVGRTLGALLALIMNLRALAEEAITPHAIKQDNACVYLVLAVPRANEATAWAA